MEYCGVRRILLFMRHGERHRCDNMSRSFAVLVSVVACTTSYFVTVKQACAFWELWSETCVCTSRISQTSNFGGICTEGSPKKCNRLSFRVQQHGSAAASRLAGHSMRLDEKAGQLIFLTASGCKVKHCIGNVRRHFDSQRL